MDASSVKSSIHTHKRELYRRLGRGTTIATRRIPGSTAIGGRGIEPPNDRYRTFKRGQPTAEPSYMPQNPKGKVVLPMKGGGGTIAGPAPVGHAPGPAPAAPARVGPVRLLLQLVPIPWFAVCTVKKQVHCGVQTGTAMIVYRLRNMCGQAEAQ